MKIGEIVDFLEGIAPPRLQESYDNAGYITGQKVTDCTGVLCCLDSTEVIIDEAIEKGCNLVVAHHPIIFSGLKSITGKHYVERVIIKAIKHDIAIYAIHTNLDNVLQDGVNTKIAEKLGVKVLRPLLPKLNLISEVAIGSGVFTEIENAMSEMDFLRHIKQVLKCDSLKYTPLLQKEVKQIAICGGSGRFLIEAAIQSGAQVFITADIKYHEYFEANNQIILVDVGHYESEQYTIELLHDLITKKFSNFAVFMTVNITNPIKYLT